MRRFPLLLLAVIALAGCANGYKFGYKADPQPSGANLFADYTKLQGGISVAIDTDGRRLEEIYILKSDGTKVAPQSIQYPRFAKEASVGTGIGVGIGPVGVGTGVGVPVGPEKAQGPTTATFRNEDIGDAPWELHVKVHGVNEAVIPGVGGPKTAK